MSPTSASTAAAGTASGTTIARSRSTSGKRPTAGASSGASRPAARPAMATSATMTRCVVRSSHASTTAGCTSPTIACQPSGDLGARGPAGVEHRLVALRGVGRAGEPEAVRQELEDALGVVEVVRAGRPVPGRRLGGADEREPEAPPLARHVPGPRVALADLEHRDVLGAVAQVHADDVEQAAEEVAAEQRVVARQRVGDADRIAARLWLVADRRHLAREHERLDVPRRHEGRRDDLGQAGAGQGLADQLPRPPAATAGTPASRCPG